MQALKNIGLKSETILKDGKMVDVLTVLKQEDQVDESEANRKSAFAQMADAAAAAYRRQDQAFTSSRRLKIVRQQNID